MIPVGEARFCHAFAVTCPPVVDSIGHTAGAHAAPEAAVAIRGNRPLACAYEPDGVMCGSHRSVPVPDHALVSDRDSPLITVRSGMSRARLAVSRSLLARRRLLR
jgi:hypothetical protein